MIISVDSAVRQPKVQVRFLDGECLWSWDLVDRSTGVVIENAWQERWLGYESPAEARAAGAESLPPLA